jgi:hypothetical protein
MYVPGELTIQHIEVYFLCTTRPLAIYMYFDTIANLSPMQKLSRYVAAYVEPILTNKQRRGISDTLAASKRALAGFDLLLEDNPGILFFRGVVLIQLHG